MSARGFWSYARSDDENLDGVLTQLRRRIEGEVSMLLGQEVDIFQDIYEMRTGDRWRDKLKENVSNSAFLIPVLTPRFFNRKWCQEEVLTFLSIAQEKGIRPKIFPVCFVEFDTFEDNDLHAALEPFQYKDFSNWRFESDPTVKERLLNSFAKDIKAHLVKDHSPVEQKTVVAPAEEVAVLETPAEPVIVEERKSPTGGLTKSLEALKKMPFDTPTKSDIDLTLEALKAAVPSPQIKASIKTYYVDPELGRGNFVDMSTAILRAEAGSRIIVNEGRYVGALHLSKPLEIIGEGEAEKIVVRSKKGNALFTNLPMVTIRGILFRDDSERAGNGVWVGGGAPVFEDCIFESKSNSCVTVTGATSKPVFRRCQARLGKKLGFNFQRGASGEMENCEAYENGIYGVFLNEDANPTIRNCTFRNNKAAGACIYEGAKGHFIDCVIKRNDIYGLYSGRGGFPEVSGTMIRANGMIGVYVGDSDSGGTFRDNDVSDVGQKAWEIAKGANVNQVGQSPV